MRKHLAFTHGNSLDSQLQQVLGEFASSEVVAGLTGHLVRLGYTSINYVDDDEFNALLRHYLDNPPPAETVAEMARAGFQYRLESELESDWGDWDAYREFLVHLRTGYAAATNGYTVVAGTALPKGWLWAHTAAEVLDRAMVRSEIGGRIDEGEGREMVARLDP